MSLGDASGAEHDGGGATHRDGRGVGEVVDAPGFASLGGLEELANDGQVGVGLEGWAWYTPAFYDGGAWEAMLPEQAMDLRKYGAFGFAGKCT